MKAVVDIPEGEIAEVREGQKARISVTALPGEIFKGTVSRIVELAKDEFDDLDYQSKEILGRAERRVFTVEIAITEPDERLRPGFNARADIIVDRREDVLIVPLAAVGILPTGAGFVEVAEKSGKTRREAVEVVAYSGDMAEVKGNIAPGSSVRLITDEERLFHAGAGAREEFSDAR